MMKKIIIVVTTALIFSFGLNISYAQSVPSEPASSESSAMDVVVYRSPTCGCCSKWVAHLKTQGFNVQDNVIEDIQKIKDQYSISGPLASCHTAVVNGYIVEGHVPATDIKTMLLEKPEISGLTVPGMVVGTPGMEMGDKKAPFKVIAFDKDGKTQIYKAYDKY